MTRPLPTRLLILGGGSDIAVAFVRRCLSSGLDHVVLAGRPGGTVDRGAADLVADHPDLSLAVEPFDGADPDTHEARLGEIDRAHGPFDTVLVAFGQLGEPFTIDARPADLGALATVNFSGAVAATQAALQVLRGEPNARLIVVSSIAAVRPRVGNLVYGSSKAGLDAFACELRAPARKVGVDVVVLRPGFVHSRMTEGLDPAPFATTPELVARDLVAGLEQAKSIIHSPNVLRPVGMVLRSLPGPIWRKISAR